MADETHHYEGKLQMAELYDDNDEWLGWAILVGEDDLLGTLSDLHGREVRVTVEVLDDGAAAESDGPA
jgi:hypothetical protein